MVYVLLLACHILGLRLDVYTWLIFTILKLEIGEFLKKIQVCRCPTVRRWIGTNSVFKWLARLLDLTPLDFVLWGYLEAEDYKHICT